MSSTDARDRKVIVMLGMHPASKKRGGIVSVVDMYRAGGLFQRWPIMFLGTVIAGSPLRKVAIATLAVVKFIGVIASGRLALLHAHASSRVSFWRKSIFITLALAAGKPVIVHLHGGEFAQFYRSECGPVRQWLIRSILQRASRVIVLSSQWVEVMRSIAPGARVVRIFNPIAIPNASSAPSARSNDELLYLGRFKERKGVFDLLDALLIVRQSVPTVKLRCGGDGDVDGFRARVQALGLTDNVEVLGWVSGAAKEQVLRRAAIYVLPSYAEGLPMGVLEAMASGAATVATHVGGVPDAITDGVEGFLVAPGDAQALAARIVQLLQDPQLRERFAAAAHAKVQELFGAEKVLAQVEDLYARLGVSPRASGPERPRTNPSFAAAGK